MKPWRLKRTKQCTKCPWRVDVDPRDIPNGYDESKHAALICTISDPGSIRDTGRAMACHESHDAHCVGWLANQIGSGNNIPLRIRMIGCQNASEMQLRGDQHLNFEETLPRSAGVSK